jgi:predicted permease
MLHDLRLAIRSLARHRAFTAVACLTLAIGVGANTAIFSVINGVLLNPLPYPDSNGLVMVNVRPDGEGRPGSMSFADMADLRDKGRSFKSLAGTGVSTQTLTDVGEPVMVDVGRVTEGLLSVFGVAPIIGRDLTREEFGENAARVAVLGHEMWQSRFGGAQDVIGKTITLNGNSYQVVGIAPAGFQYPTGAQLWIPREMSLTGCARGCHTFTVVGRLNQGVTLEAATAELAQFSTSLEATYPETNTGKAFMVRGLKDAIVGDVRTGLWLMFGAAALVLLIACANVANLLLARASSREGEVAVRVALGASRRHLATHVLAESAILALVGGTVGIAIAVGGVSLLRTLATGTIPRADVIALDGTVLAVSLVSVVLVLAVFAAIPMFTASRANVAGTMSTVGRGGSTGSASVRFRRALLTAEVALSACLLIGAGLLMRSFTQLNAIDVGFNTSQVTRFSLVLPALRYDSLSRASLFYEELEQETAAIPGVEAVGAMFGPPLGRGNAAGGVQLEGKPEPPPEDDRVAFIRSVTPGALSALGVKLSKGRLLAPSDNRRDAEPVALVNEEFVRQQFPNEDPIGKRFLVTVDLGYGSPYWRIVGVVKDVRFASLTESAGADVYLPHAQFGPLSTTVHVRTAPGAPSPVNAIRDIVASLDPNVPMYRIETIEQVMETATAPARLYLVLVALFAGIAALLAAIGLYGVVSYIVVQRTREIGIRVALGAQRPGIVSLLMRQGMQPVVIGLVIGVAGALAVGRYVESVLYGVRPNDPFIVVGAVSLMAVVAAIATIVPALRASGIDPARVLQGD